jgi:hypothetical protein
MKFKQRLTNLQNVSPGNTATLTLPVGKNAPTLDKIQFELSGGMLPAHIESVRGKANGVMFYDEITGTIINKRDDYRGIFTDPLFLTVDFTEPNARNGAIEQLAASVPLSLVQQMIFEIKIAAGAPALGRIDASMLIRPPTNNPYIKKQRSSSVSYPNSGEQIAYLPTGGAGGKLTRIYIHEQTPGTITNLELRVGNTVSYEVTRAKLEYEQKRNGLVPQAGIVVLDFIEDGNLSGVMDTGTSANIELRITSSAANTYQVFYQLVDPIGR